MSRPSPRIYDLLVKPRTKKVIYALLVAFVVFFVFSAPTEAAEIVRQTAEFTWNLLSGAADSMQTFVVTLIR